MSSAATRCRLHRLVGPYKRGAFAYFLGVPHDFQAGQQFHITCWPASLHVPDTLRLVGRVIFRPVLGQVLSAVCSSSRQASLSRPATMANRTAALQVGARSNLGGPSATATATSNPINRDAMAIVSGADIAFPLVRAASAIPGIVALGTTIQDYSDEREGMQRVSEPLGASDAR
jgi:hypothetical protein